MKSELLKLADELERAERQGEAVDEPEGNRYVIISDTLVKKIVAEMRLVDLINTRWENDLD